MIITILLVAGISFLIKTSEGLLQAAGFAVAVTFCFVAFVLPFGLSCVLIGKLLDVLGGKDYDRLLDEKEQEVLRKRGLSSIEDIK